MSRHGGVPGEYRFLVRQGELAVELLGTGRVLAYREWRILRDLHRGCCEQCPHMLEFGTSPSGQTGTPVSKSPADPPLPTRASLTHKGPS